MGVPLGAGRYPLEGMMMPVAEWMGMQPAQAGQVRARRGGLLEVAGEMVGGRGVPCQGTDRSDHQQTETNP